jgi:NAD(P)-dependent dehydrogenase (short-subunit alcohol dehydrogenase family)
MDLGVKGRTYILVGGSKGMGFEAARALAAEGARLALISRSQATLDAAADALRRDHGAEVAVFPADGMVRGAVEAAVEAAVARLGAPRGLLVTSGLTDRNGDLLSASDDDWQANFDDVVMGTVRACRATVPHLIAAGGGQIVTTAAYSVRAAKSFLFPYASLKSALVNFTKNLSKTYGGQGIRANCVCPGAFETERVAARIEATMAEKGVSRAEASADVMEVQFKMPVALRRPGQAKEAGELMAFLLSERAAYMTGAVINIDGGTDF